MRKLFKILGIFGGMGPEATVDFYRRIIKQTHVDKDQDHIPTLIYSLPQVPDRSYCIENNDDSIVPYLIEGVTRLERAGASFIAIPCNTVHYFFNRMQEAVSIPILHIIRETVKEVRTNYPKAKNIGLLATSGTIQSKVYEDELTRNGFKIVIPDEKLEIEKVMKAVHRIKAGTNMKDNARLLTDAARHIIKEGAELIVLGCTEIPLAFNAERVDIPVVNATEVLASAAIHMYHELK